jgi:DNA polymerase III sliding clamp (beta) subunit (PCNA family)
MKIERKPLLAAMALASAGLGKNTANPENNQFYFIDDKLVTYNDEVSVSIPLVFTGDFVTASVDSDLFNKYLQKVTVDSIELVETEGGDEGRYLQVKASRSKAGFAMGTTSLPLDEINPKKWVSLPEGFMEGMNFASMVCSRDATNPKYTLVSVNKRGYMDATDNYRVIRYSFEKKFKFPSFLIPSSSVRHLSGIAPTHISYSDDGWVHFKKDDAIFSTRVFNDDFPDVSPLLDISGKEVPLPDVLSDAITRTKLFQSNGLDSSVTIKLQKRKMRVRAESDTAWVDETIPIKFDGDLEFNVNPEFLEVMMGLSLECVVTDRFICFSTDNWTYTASLIV